MKMKLFFPHQIVPNVSTSGSQVTKYWCFSLVAQSISIWLNQQQHLPPELSLQTGQYQSDDVDCDTNVHWPTREGECIYIERNIATLRPSSTKIDYKVSLLTHQCIQCVCVYIYIYIHTHIYKEVSHNPSTVYINKYKQTYGGCSLWKPFVVVSHFRHLDARTEREYNS